MIPKLKYIIIPKIQMSNRSRIIIEYDLEDDIRLIKKNDITYPNPSNERTINPSILQIVK